VNRREEAAVVGRGAAPDGIVVFELSQLGPGAAPFLCDQLTAALADRPDVTTVLCDVGSIQRPTPHDLDHLARLRSTAMRLDRALRLRNASPQLRLLLELTGLGEVLVCD
jgi:hypothetical protein